MNALLIALSLLCAAPETEVIAKVGNEIVTMEEFNKLFQVKEGITNVDSLKQATVDKLIANKLMLIDAKNKQLDTLVQRPLQDFQNRLTIGKLYEKVVTQRVKVSPWKVRLAWWHMNPVLKVSQMMIKDKDTANMVYRKLRKGEDFISLATRYSEDYSAKYGGNLPDIRRGSGDRELENIAFSLRHEGAFSRPMKTVQGYRIVKLNKIVKKPLPEFENEKDKLEQKLKGEVTRKLSDGYLRYLKRIAHIRYNKNALNKIIKDNVQDNDRNLTLAHWAGGSLTVAEFLKKTEMDKARGRRFDSKEAINQWLEGVVLFETMLPSAAARYRFDKLPDIQKQIKEREEFLLLQQYREKEINAKAAPTPEQVETYYKQYKKEKYENKKLETINARVSWDLEQEMRTAKEQEVIAELRANIPVEIVAKNL